MIKRQTETAKTVKVQVVSMLAAAVMAAAMLTLNGCGNQPEQPKALREVLTGMNYGDSVLVVGHKSPDCDAVVSAICYAALLQRMGINAKPRVAGKVVCEPLYVLQEAGIAVPAILDDATGLNMVMVDHSEFSQAVDGMPSANILHIIDHHGTGSVTTAHPLFYYALPVGSTCSVIAILYEQLGEHPTASEARLLLSGLLSDTDSLTAVITTDTDRRLFAELLALSDITDIGSYYAAVREARTSFAGMNDMEILYSDFKKYEIEGVKVGIGSVFAGKNAGVEELCRRMRQLMPAAREESGLDMLFMMIGDRDADISHVPFCGEGAREVAEYGFHTTATADDCIVTTYLSSRKAEVVPAVTEGIRHWKEQE